MVLSFSTKFPDGRPNYFIEKIWRSLFIFDAEKHYYSEQPLFLASRAKGLIGGNVWHRQPKIHTIRKDSKKRWRQGRDIDFAINNRTKDWFRFAPVVPCVSVQEIEILVGFTASHLQIAVDERALSKKEVKELVLNDGFESVEQFLTWFTQDFRGRIIHWTDMSY